MKVIILIITMLNSDVTEYSRFQNLKECEAQGKALYLEKKTLFYRCEEKNE